MLAKQRATWLGAGIGAFLSRPLQVTAVEHLAADYNRLYSWL